MKLRFPFLCAILITGCASLGPKFSSLQPQPKSKALVYVYRPKAFTGSVRSPNITVNDKKIGEIPNGGYLVAEVDSGRTTIAQTDFVGEKSTEETVVLQPNQTYFLRFDLSLPNFKNKITYEGKVTDEKCKFMGFNATLASADIRLFQSMDTRVQKAGCSLGFFFVKEELALKELPETSLVKK